MHLTYKCTHDTLYLLNDFSDFTALTYTKSYLHFGISVWRDPSSAFEFAVSTQRVQCHLHIGPQDYRAGMTLTDLWALINLYNQILY